MHAHSPLPFDIPADPAADHAAWGQGVLQRQSAMVEQLAEAGLRMAQAIERRVTEAPVDGEAPVAPTEAAMAFARVARAVRMAALLQTRLVRELGQFRSWAGVMSQRAREEAETAQARLDPAYAHKARVEAIVERVAKADCEDEDRLDQLSRETAERLDDDDIYGDVLTRPVGELVSLICRDLGLEPDWTRLGEEAWARKEIDNPRSPFFATSPACGGPPADLGEAGGRAGGGEGGRLAIPDRLTIPKQFVDCG